MKVTFLIRPLKEFNVCSRTLFSIQNNKSIAVKCVKYASTNPVNLSYSFYESKNSENNKGNPLIILHGLFGNKSSWRSISKTFVEKTAPARNVFALDARNHGESPHDPVHSYASMVEDVVKFFKDQGIKKAAVLGHSMGGRIALLLAIKNHGESPHDPVHSYASMVEDVVKFFKDQGIKKAAVLGHSMGGRIALLLAIKYPELVEKAIIVDVTQKQNPSVMGLKIYFDILLKVNFDNIESMEEARSSVNTQLKSSISDKSIREYLLCNNLKEEVDGSFGWRTNLDVLRNHFETHIMCFPSDVSGFQYLGPMLFIAGANSDYISEKDFPGLKSQLYPNANLAVVANAGHWVHMQQPQIFFKLALNFLNDT